MKACYIESYGGLEVMKIGELPDPTPQRGQALVEVEAASVNPVEHYGLDIGLLRAGDDADFVVVDNLEALTVLKTYIKGHLVAEDGEPRIPRIPAATINRFKATAKTPAAHYENRPAGGSKEEYHERFPFPQGLPLPVGGGARHRLRPRLRAHTGSPGLLRCP